MPAARGRVRRDLHVPPLAPSPKNSVKQRAGRAGAAARWPAQPAAVRLDGLPPAARRLVLALVDAARREAARESANTSQET